MPRLHSRPAVRPARARCAGAGGRTVKHGTGRYARATGSGRATFSEDAANRHRMTLVGRIAG